MGACLNRTVYQLGVMMPKRPMGADREALEAAGTLVCTRCGEVKPLDEFRYYPLRRQHRRQCFACEREAAVERFARLGEARPCRQPKARAKARLRQKKRRLALGLPPSVHP